MLFHTLSAPHSGAYLQQMVCILQEDLEHPALDRAWRRVLDRHAVLRTSFRWEGLDEPVQAVAPHVDVPVETHDWRGLLPGEQGRRLAEFLEADRRRGFELDRAPLLRVTHLRLGEVDNRLVWTCHPALVDRRSHLLLLKEVFAFYDAFRQGHDLALESPRPYRDYIDWLGKQDCSLAEPFWRRLLKGFRAPTPLLSVAPAPGNVPDSNRGHGERTLRLPAGLTADLHALAKQEGLTVDTLIQGAWAVLLGRYSGEEEVVFGATRICRRSALEGADAMVGVFSNTLPVRARLTAGRPALDLLKDLRAQSLALRPYEHTPLRLVQQWSDVPRGMPLFDTVVVFERCLTDTALRAQGGAWEHRTAELHEEANFPVALAAFDGADLRLKALYNRERFDEATIDRMLGHVRSLLEGFAADPQQAVGDLPLLTVAERRQIIFDWNDTRADIPRDRCIHHLFEEQVAWTPDAVAVIYECRELTYSELNRRANRLAHYLQRLGVGPETLVGICVRRSAEMIVGVLGILKAGGAYVPLDPTYPKDRLAFILEDTRAPVLLTQQALADRLPETGARVLCLDNLGDALAEESPENPPGPATPNIRAYVIYTSGSTGKPKGVVLRHTPVVNLIDWVNRTFRVGPADRLLFVTSINFDLSVYDIFGILASGGSVRVATGSELRDPERLLRILCDEPITFWNSAPAMLQQLAPFFSEARAAAGHKALLRLVFLSGDWIPVPLPDAVRAAFPGAEVVSLGGATEAAIWSNYYRIGAVDPAWPSIPYGKPIQNARYHILDARLQPVPVGVPAELHIGGLCLADGYFNRPGLTGEKFIPDQFSAEPDARLYKTGDLARYFPNGNIELLGRLDHQVKIRGFRIELGEIETALARHPAVRECVVLARKDEAGDRYLAAYVVPRPGPEASPADLRRFLSETLPEYTVPAHYVLREAFPLNPNGKIDRQALPAPDLARAAGTAAYVAPRNPTEKALADIWSEVLGVERAGIHDDFFALGGHSLKATQAVSRIRQRLRVELTLPAFFEAPTIAGLSPALGNGSASGGTPPAAVPSIPRAGGAGPQFPASFPQQRLWLLDQLETERDVYNVPFALEIDGPVNAAALRQALQTMADRQGALRTTFAIQEGLPVQVIAPALHVELPVIDLGDRPPGEREAEAERLAQADAGTPFDLAGGPLWRARLVRLGPRQHRLILVLHHISTDEWSMAVFFRDLAWLYDAAAGGSPADLPELPLRYADFAVWQRQWLQGQVLQERLAYWRARLAGVATLHLPTDRPRPKRQTFRGAVFPFDLPAPLVHGVQELSRRERVTPFMTLLAAFKCLLQRYTFQEDVPVGTPIANRNRVEVENLVGVFINTLVMRTDLSGDPTFRTLLGRVREGALGAYAHQDLPFEKLVEELQPERDPSRQPLFQVLFNYQTEPVRPVTAGGCRWAARLLHNGTSKFDLTLFIEETPHGQRAKFEYNTDLFEPATVERMAGHYLTLLAGALADPDRRLGQIPLLTESERRLLLEWNDTRADYPGRCTHQLFEEQAARAPNRPAVTIQNEQVSYGELNARANQVAHYLKTLGVGADVPVGLCVERSVQMVLGALAILKAGGAYVPLDPAFPPERLSFYVEDSRLPVLLTQEHLRGRVPAPGAPVVCLDGDRDAIATMPTHNPPPSSGPDNLVYVIYTSGSTGKPKGVQVLQRALTNLLTSLRQEPGLTADDVLLSVTTLSFDIHALELWLPLTTGARVVVVSREEAADGSRLVERLEQSRATVLQATPATYQLLLASGWQGSPRLTALCGGEQMNVELAAQLLPRVAALWNMYGPTETTVWSTAHRVTSADGTIPIGRPIANTQVYLVDRALQLVPVGVAGELLIDGDGVARGYHNRPELTAEKFIPDPFRPGAGGRLYRTGDLARYLPDGTLECLGRIDHQVKVRGYRIELGEIETLLGQHPAVRACVVVARKEESGVDSLAAYLLVKPGQEAAPEAFRAFLQDRLPDYMVPSHFVTLEAFPLTPNGKIDRKALPAPDSAATEGRPPFVAPRTEVEWDLTEVWMDVLKVKPIGVHDNFFDLGGHSFLAAVLMARIKQQLGQSLPLGTLFEAPTVEKLAAVLQQHRKGGSGSSLVALHEGGSNPPLFLISGLGGHVFKFYKVARLLGPDQPAYGVKAIGVDGVLTPPGRIEDVAAHYLREITAFRPRGPYLVGGYSVGGTVAFELACQLQAGGHEVGLLVVLDTFAPGYPRKLSAPRRALIHLGNFIHLGWREKRAYVGERLRNLRRRVLLRLGLGAYAAPEVPGLEQAPTASAFKQVWGALAQAEKRYWPRRKFDGRVVLFKATEEVHWAATVFDDPLFGWERWATGGVEARVIPGAHLEMFEDKNAEVLARELKGFVQDAQAAANATPVLHPV
jgi:amino acid adenylation domain-containing protein